MTTLVAKRMQNNNDADKCDLNGDRQRLLLLLFLLLLLSMMKLMTMLLLQMLIMMKMILLLPSECQVFSFTAVSLLDAREDVDELLFSWSE